jgi:hypothetical protein
MVPKAPRIEPPSVLGIGEAAGLAVAVGLTEGLADGVAADSL